MISSKAKALKIPYIETSAKDGTNINEAFTDMARKILQKKSEAGNRDGDRLTRHGGGTVETGSRCKC